MNCVILLMQFWYGLGAWCKYSNILNFVFINIFV